MVLFQMLTGLHSVLKLETLECDGKMVHICEEEDQQGAFIIHHFLQMAIKKKTKAIVIGLESSFGHFNGIG